MVEIIRQQKYGRFMKMGLHAIDEAKRCLNCKKPACVEGCPISTPVPAMIRMFLDGQMTEGAQMVFANNPLSVICSLVCDHEKQCEGHCVTDTTQCLSEQGRGVRTG